MAGGNNVAHKSNSKLSLQGRRGSWQLLIEWIMTLVGDDSVTGSCLHLTKVGAKKAAWRLTIRNDKFYLPYNYIILYVLSTVLGQKCLLGKQRLHLSYIIG